MGIRPEGLIRNMEEEEVIYKQRPKPAEVGLHVGLGARCNRVTPLTTERSRFITHNIILHRNPFLLRGSKIIRLYLKFVERRVFFFFAVL
jgi:hypothetical protein